MAADPSWAATRTTHQHSITARRSEPQEEQSLNTNHFGWGYFLPLGIKYIFKKDSYITSEIRFSRKYISFVASEGYLKELDETILQSFQFVIQDMEDHQMFHILLKNMKMQELLQYA